MGDANPIRTLGDYSKPSHKGYKNTIEPPKGKFVPSSIRHHPDGVKTMPHSKASVPKIQNHHLKDFLKLVDSLDLNGSITTWEDLTTRFPCLRSYYGRGQTPRPSSMQVPQAYAEAVYSNPCLQNQNEPSKQNPFTFHEQEEEKDVVNNREIIESIVEPRKSEEEEPPKKASVMNEVERRADDEPTKSVRENVMKNEEEEAAGASVTPPKLGGLKHTNALVDQGSDVNVMPFSTYNKLTNESPAETDIKLSLASHSYIYPLWIAKDVSVDVVGYVYPMDFMILDIKEDENKPFILGTPFLTTAKAVIKFDKGTITLRSGKSKISFHRIPESLCKVKKGIKNDIEPIVPIMTVNRLVLEWEEKIKLHQEKEMKFDQWRSKNFRNKHPDLLYLMRRSLEVLRKFHWMILGGRFNQLSHVSSPLLSKPGEYFCFFRIRWWVIMDNVSSGKLRAILDVNLVEILVLSDKSVSILVAGSEETRCCARC
ncbi:MAK10-like protein [Tanacetum coccineum]